VILLGLGPSQPPPVVLVTAPRLHRVLRPVTTAPRNPPDTDAALQAPARRRLQAQRGSSGGRGRPPPPRPGAPAAAPWHTAAEPHPVRAASTPFAATTVTVSSGAGTATIPDGNPVLTLLERHQELHRLHGIGLLLAALKNSTHNGRRSPTPSPPVTATLARPPTATSPAPVAAAVGTTQTAAVRCLLRCGVAVGDGGPQVAALQLRRSARSARCSTARQGGGRRREMCPLVV
jgi:hypothetical protein